MRRNFLLLTMILAFLAACNGNAPAPTAQTSADNNTAATSAPPTITPSLQAPVSTQERIYETGQPPIPIAGTIVMSESTPDPDVGLVFDLIQYQQSGGITGDTLVIEVHGDGTMIRDGVTGNISPEQVALLDNMIDQMHFFDINGVFTSPGSGADLIRYSVTVTRAGTSVTLDAQDGLVPPELQQLFSILSSLGAPA